MNAISRSARSQGLPWNRVLLDKVATRGSGHTPNKKRADYWNGSVRWVSLRDTFRMDQGLISETTASITHAGLANSSAVVHPSGSVILLRDAGIGKSAVLQSDMAVSQHFMAWSCGPRLNNWYLYYYLQSMKSEFERISNGSTIKTIGLDYFRQLTIPLPEIEEQCLISRMLLDIDEFLASLEQLVTKKQAIKQGLMQELLTGRRRLPGFTEPWRTRRLCDLLTYEQPSPYLVRTSKQLDAGRVPVLTAGKTFILGFTNESHGIFRDHPVVIFDDFTTTSKYVDFDFKVKSSAIKILKARDGADLRFVHGRMQLIDFSLGDHKRYWISEYSKQELLVPDVEEQTAVAQVLADADDEIDALKVRIEKARSVKQGMLQELLTGRTRLPVQGEDDE
ncbi:restriction endonuclease subunit S [Streptomyces sp. NPDC088817]|uniref:restriction endonuclease subunit S n=1 Tax=Streptomyces sp. NPDC088817 TaxID=3365907 RepID=UPI00381EDFBE